MVDLKRKSLLVPLLFVLFAGVSAGAVSLSFGNFAESGLDGWTEKVFHGKTDYRIVEESGQRVLQARSRGTASGLVFKTEYAAQEYPVLSWRWKVENIIDKGDGRTKSGDDYAARIYVVFPHWFFLKTRTLNYIWANRLPKETVLASAYTKNSMMIVVESGSENVGAWMSVQRNVLEDYRMAFGEEPPAVGAVAIMTDTDDTGESAVAWYGDIKASRE